MKKLLFTLTVFAAFLSLSNCASIVSKSDYPVRFTSSSNQKVAFTVKDEDGVTMHSGVTPSTATLSASSGFFQPSKYTLRYNGSNTRSVSAKIDPWYGIGNLFFGGVIGYLIVDPLTGSMWKLPKEVTLH